MVKLWNLETGRREKIQELATNKVATAGTVSRDGTLLVIGYKDGTVDLRDFATGELRRVLHVGASEVARLRASGDGTRLAVILAPCPGGDFTVWDTTNGRPLPGAPRHVGGSASAIEFANRRPLLAIGHHDDNSITLWDLAKDRELYPLAGHEWVVNGLAFSSDDRVLASSSWDATVRLWDVATGKSDEPHLNTHGLAAGLGGFSPDGRTLAVGGIRKGITLWHVAAHQEMGTFLRRVPGGGECRFSPDGKTLALGSPLASPGPGPKVPGVQFWRAPSVLEIDSQRPDSVPGR